MNTYKEIKELKYEDRVINFAFMEMVSRIS